MSHWAHVPFLEHTFHGAGQEKADWGFGFFPSQEPLRHTPRARSIWEAFAFFS